MSAPDPPQKVLFTFNVVGSTFFGNVMLDASILETHSRSAQVSKHPVENGPDVTDHIRPLPARLTIEGVITNCPIDVPATQNGGISGRVQDVAVIAGGKQVTYRAFQFDGEFDRVREAFGVLGDAIQAGALFSVFTTLKSYANLAASDFTVPRDVSKGNSLEFTIQFEEVILVSAQVVDALPPSIQKQHRGAKTGKQLDPNADGQQVSALSKAVDKIVAAFK